MQSLRFYETIVTIKLLGSSITSTYTRPHVHHFIYTGSVQNTYRQPLRRTVRCFSEQSHWNVSFNSVKGKFKNNHHNRRHIKVNALQGLVSVVLSHHIIQRCPFASRRPSEELEAGMERGFNPSALCQGIQRHHQFSVGVAATKEKFVIRTKFYERQWNFCLLKSFNKR